MEKIIYIYHHIINLFRINIIKTIYVNIKLFSLADALKCPVIIYGPCKVKVKGKIVSKIPIKTGVLRIGCRVEILNYSSSSQFLLFGTLLLNGEAQLGTSVGVYVKEKGILELGAGTFIGAFGTIICTKHIVLSEYSRVGAKSIISDSNYHYMKNISSGKVYRKEREVFIGAKNWIGMKTALLPGTKTPNNLTIGFGSFCNRDYTTDIPENSVIAGVPAKLVKENAIRIFDFEQERMIDDYFKLSDSSFYYIMES